MVYRCLERWSRASLEAQAFVTSRLRLGDDVFEHSAAHTLAKVVIARRRSSSTIRMVARLGPSDHAMSTALKSPV